MNPSGRIDRDLGNVRRVRNVIPPTYAVLILVGFLIGPTVGIIVLIGGGPVSGLLWATLSGGRKSAAGITRRSARPAARASRRTNRRR
jgi:hypothetical protein